MFTKSSPPSVIRLSAAILALMVAMAVISFRYVSLIKRANKSFLESIVSEQRLTAQKGNVSELARILRNIPIADDRLLGDTVFAPESYRKSGNRTTLIFVMSPRCGVCTQSLPLLDSIERGNPGTVVGVAFADTKASVEAYSTLHHLRFPIILAPMGSFAQRLPRHATPIFVVKDSATIRDLEIGFTDMSAARLRALYQREKGKSASDK